MPAAANLVHQSSVSTGTGNFTLAAINGKRNFATVFGSGTTTNVFDYFISNQGAAEWERGTGHMSDATTLVRDTVLESSNSNALVSFSVGTKDIANDIPAQSQINNPMTTRGDIISRGASTYQRLALGSSGKVLATDGTDVLANYPDWSLLTSGVIANSATSLDFVLTAYTALRALRFVLNSLLPATNGVALQSRFSTNGGSSYDATAGNYHWGLLSSPASISSKTAIGSTNASGDTLIGLTDSVTASRQVNSSSFAGTDVVLTLMDQVNAGMFTKAYWMNATINNAATPVVQLEYCGTAYRGALQDTDAIRFLWSSGNFAAANPGKYAVYGLT